MTWRDGAMRWTWTHSSVMMPSRPSEPMNISSSPKPTASGLPRRAAIIFLLWPAKIMARPKAPFSRFSVTEWLTEKLVKPTRSIIGIWSISTSPIARSSPLYS